MLVIGAGASGLVVARTLHTNGVKVSGSKIAHWLKLSIRCFVGIQKFSLSAKKIWDFGKCPRNYPV